MNDNVLTFPGCGRVLEHRSIDAQLDPARMQLSFLNAEGRGLELADARSAPEPDTGLVALLRVIATHIQTPRAVHGAVYASEERGVLVALEAAQRSAARLRTHQRLDEVLVPASAHESIVALVEEVGLRPVLVRVDPFTDLASPRAMAQALSRRSLMMIASAPTPSDGLVDPISELAALAAGHGVWLHVDASAGGFLLPYEARLLPALADFGFWSPGVSSVAINITGTPSLDASPVALFARGAELGRHPLPCSEIEPETARELLLSLRALGDAGHLEMVMRGVQARAELLRFIGEHPDLRSHPRGGLREVQFSCQRSDSSELIDGLHERGWWLRSRPCPRTGVRRICVPINPASADHIRRLVLDLEAILPRR